jgi:hypothetical protein
MKRMIFCLGRLGLLGLVWMVATHAGQAWERPPVKINTKIEFQFDVKVGPDFRRPTAPWYAYFPVDPRMLPSAQTTPYPPWPTPFPPPASPPAAAREAPRQVQGMGTASDAPLSQVWYHQNVSGMNLQPVGYLPTQAPSYWYRNP